MRRLIASTLLCWSASSLGADAVGVLGNNTQIVVVKGAVTNEATSGATARINVGAVTSSRIAGNNKQTIVVSGSITNVSKGAGSKSEINIGSVNAGEH